MEGRLIEYGILLLVWALAAGASGGLLALLARRLHPDLSLRRLWLFYTVMTALLAAVVFLVWSP